MRVGHKSGSALLFEYPMTRLGLPYHPAMRDTSSLISKLLSPLMVPLSPSTSTIVTVRL